MKIKTSALIASACIILTACKNNKDPVAQYPESPTKGLVIDAPIVNMPYATETQSGFTDDEGMFRYRDGETIQFGIANIGFATVEVKAVMTLPDILDRKNVDFSVINLARLLQSIGEVGEVITLPENLGNQDLRTLILELDFDRFASQSIVAVLLGDKKLVSPQAAVDHLYAEASKRAITLPDILPALDADGDKILDVADVDSDGDGYREVRTPADLGTAANPLSMSAPGCPDNGCRGIELVNDINFDTNNNGKADVGDQYYSNDADGAFRGRQPMPLDYDIDGQGYTISYLYMNYPDTNELGLYSIAGNEDRRIEIKNLNIENAIIQGANSSGALTGTAHNVHFKNIRVNAIVMGGHNVGLVAGSNGGDMLNVHSSGQVSGESIVGGLVGESTAVSRYTNSSSSATVESSASVDAGAGGLIGHSSAPITLQAVSSTGDISANGAAGGLVGSSDGGISINNCYSQGTINSSNAGAGGIIGNVLVRDNSYLASVFNCYASGGISGNNSGGLVGRNSSEDNQLTLRNSYWSLNDSNPGIAVNAAETGTHSGVFGVSEAQLRCPINAGNTDCAASTMYLGWDNAPIDHDHDSSTDEKSPWRFGSGSELPSIGFE
jgi:hypothetical protein